LILGRSEVVGTAQGIEQKVECLLRDEVMRDAGADDGTTEGKTSFERAGPSLHGVPGIALLPMALMLLGLLGLALVERSTNRQKEDLSKRISEQRRNIEPVTGLRRDARKTYVALLERWLLPRQDWARARRDIEDQAGALTRSSQDIVAGAGLTAEEQQHRADLAAALAAWMAFLHRNIEVDAGMEVLGEAREIIARIDRACGAILTINLDRASRDDAVRQEAERRSELVHAIVVSLRVLLLAYIVVWHLRTNAARRLAEALRQRRQEEKQNLVLERLVRERTAALETSQTQLSQSMVQLAGAKAELEKRLTDLATAHNQLLQAEKLQAVGQLAAGLAHEVNTPTQFIGDGLHFLKEAFVGYQRLIREYRCAVESLGTTDAGRVLVDNLRRTEEDADLAYFDANVPTSFVTCLDGVIRISSIVKAMKEFAQPDQRQKALADLNQALQATLVVARGDYAEVAEITTELGDLPLVLCHVADLNQVFLSLIINAAHAIEDVVAKGSGKGTIGIRTAREGDVARIDISDSGCGIPEAIRNRVFEPFFTTKEVGKGTGQGLAIARSVVVVGHGGTLTFESEIGKGTTFTIRLPIGGEPSGLGTTGNETTG
jgi:signal transduction histidine kinase